jgi:hypothetical protein
MTDDAEELAKLARTYPVIQSDAAPLLCRSPERAWRERDEDKATIDAMRNEYLRFYGEMDFLRSIARENGWVRDGEGKWTKP